MKKKLQFLFSMVTMMLVAFTAKAQVYIETDLTSSFNSVATTQWTGSSGQVGWAAPQVKTNSGLTVAAWESYVGSCSSTGTVMKTTVSGLIPGTYKIELYGAAAFTFGRGFGSTAFTGDLSKDTSEGYQPNQSIPSETGVSLYAKTSEGTVEQEIPIWYATDFNTSGISTATLDNVVVGANGEVEIGMNKTSTSTNWHVVQLKGVTATVDADAALSTAVANAEAVDTSILPASLATEIASAISTYKNQTYENPEDYIAAIDVLNGLCSKATVYPACKGYLDAIEAQLSNTNVYTEDAYATYYGNVLASYEAGTLDPDAAAEYTVSNAWNTGWHAANKLDDILLSAWTVGGTQAKDYDAAIYINTWSVEGDNDGSNFKAPFFEYWTNDGNSLGANTLTATIEGLEPNSTYAAKAWIRVRAKNGYTAPAYGITMDVNGGEAVDVAAGEQVGTSQFYIAEFMAVGQTDVDGILHININVAADNNISWLSFKDVMYLTADEYEAYEKQAAYEAATAAIVDGNYYTISTKVNDKTFYLTTASNQTTFTDDPEAATAYKFSASKVDGTLYETGWNLGYRFTNPATDGGAEGTPKNEGYIRSDSKNDRNDWERQVFFLKDGEYAVRATNANSVNWGANTYWTVTDASQELPIAGYGVEMAYCWTLTDVTAKNLLAEAQDIVDAKEGVGEGLFLISEEAYSTFATAVTTAAEVINNAESSPEAVATAQANLRAAMEAYAAAAVQPDADKLYTFQLKLGGETPLYMNLTADGITIAEAATPLKFIATEKAGQFNLSDEEGNLFVGLAGGNAWTMSTAVDKKAAWTFTALGDGAYRINNLVTTGRFVGTNSADKDAGKPCYADKQTSNGNVDWIIAEVAGPVEPVDYTSYIKDADFATTGGWTENVSDGYRNYGVFAIGGDEMVQFAPPTADETHLTTEYAAGFEARWATSFASYIQTIAELPAGNYKLTYDVENVNANTAAANYNNLFTVTVGEKVFMDESTEWMSDKTAWTQHTIRFTVEEASPVTISFGYGTGENNFPASDTPALYVSHLKLDTYDPVADNKDELTEVITYAEALAADELKTEGVEEFADAISTAKYVLETATTAEELANAIDALRAAITTFTLANQFIWDGVVYIIDVETGKKMAAGHDWGTRGIVNDLGLDLTLVSDETTRTVTIDSRVSNGGQRHFLGSNLYMDSPAFGWILQYRGFGFYISNGTKYISLDENDNLVLSETPHEWILVTSDGVKEQLLSEMADATAESPVDATFFIKANNFNRNDLRIAESWTVSADCTNSNLCGGSDVNRCAESYHSTFTISQTIEGLPAGVYKMTAQGFYRQDEALEEDAPVFFANDAVAALPAKAGEENNMSDASAAFTSGLYTIEPIEFVVGEEGVVTLGVKNESATNQWIVFDNFQLTYYGAEQPEPLNPDLIELALDVDRYTGMGYNVTEAEVDFTAAKEFLGVEAITYDMVRIVNPDGEEISDYAPYDGWFNADGVAETWGSNTKVCVKFWQAIEDGKYEICDMNDADVVDQTYSVKWALVANDKKVFYTINVKFVDKPAIAITYDDLNIVETVTSDFSFEVGTCYQGSTATVDVAAILAELGVASLDDVTIYAVQSDKSLDDNYKLGTTDGWRNAAGDWQGWGADAYFYVKADFSAAESQLYQVGTMDPSMNENIAADDVYTAKYVFVKGDDAHSAVELDVVVTMTSAVGINGIALDAENSAVYDLTGRRVKNVVKGNLYIINGKKILVK